MCVVKTILIIINASLSFMGSVAVLRALLTSRELLQKPVHLNGLMIHDSPLFRPAQKLSFFIPRQHMTRLQMQLHFVKLSTVPDMSQSRRRTISHHYTAASYKTGDIGGLRIARFTRARALVCRHARRRYDVSYVSTSDHH